MGEFEVAAGGPRSAHHDISSTSWSFRMDMGHFDQLTRTSSGHSSLSLLVTNSRNQLEASHLLDILSGKPLMLEANDEIATVGIGER